MLTLIIIFLFLLGLAIWGKAFLSFLITLFSFALFIGFFFAIYLFFGPTALTIALSKLALIAYFTYFIFPKYKK